MKSLDLFNMPCLWHMLQLSVLKAFNLRKVAKMLGRVRMIAAHFHRSALGMKQFAIQENLQYFLFLLQLVIQYMHYTCTL